MGLGLSVKKVGFSTMKVHVFTIYTEPGAAAESISAVNKDDDNQVATALLKAPCTKALQMHMLRDVPAEKFGGQFCENLKPLVT